MSLIEVLVALLVLGIGVMGYAALQLRSVKMSEDTYSRSQAMAIGQDAIERIRANLDGLPAYLDAGWGDEGNPVPAPSCIFTANLPDAAAACTAEQMASQDIYEIRQSARSMLPNGSVAVVPCDQLACVIVAWNETIAATSTGADTDECKQRDIDDGDRGNAGSCVVIDFIP